MTIEAMRQALTVLEEIADEVFSPYDNKLGDAITALRAAIEQAQPDELMIWKSRAMSAERIIEKFMQPEQEPVAWMCSDASLISKDYSRFSRTCAGEWNIPVYTAPRQWQGLTDDEAVDLLPYGDWEIESTLKFARAIEAKLKEKNT